MDQKKVEETLKRIQKLYNELGEKNPFKGMDSSKVAASVTETKRLSAALDGVQSRVDNLDQSFSNLQSQLQATIKEIAKAPTPIKQMQSGFKAVLTQVKKLTYEEEGIDKLNIKQLKNIQKITNARISDSSKAAELIAKEGGFLLSNGKLMDSFILKRKTMTDAQRAAVGFLQEEDETIQSINDKIKKRIAFETKVNENLGLGGNVIKGIGSSLNKLGMGGLSEQLGLGKAQEDMEEAAKKIQEIDEFRQSKGKSALDPMTKKQMVLKRGFSSMKGSILKNLKDPLVIATFVIKEMIDALKASDKATGELAKSMNISYSEANSMRNELQVVANLSGDVMINTKGLQESLMAVNAELGTNVMLNSENLKIYTKLREASGLTMDDQKGIVALTNATKGNAEDITKEFLGAARATATNNKAVLNEKTLLKDIQNISAATTLSFGKDAGLIGDTVATVKALGLEMGKVEGIADSLLDFESSIENELQAELLLNKDLNLEKARQAALNNDLATVATEIAKQAGSSAEFGEMNRIQQEALAKAVGMNREELAKTLFVQEQIGNVSEEEANLREQRINKLQAEGLSNEQIKKKLGEETFDSLKNQASVQERLNKSLEKLREVFISIAGPVMSIVSPLLDLLNLVLPGIATSLQVILYPLTLLSEGINGVVDAFSTGEGILISMAKLMGGLVGTALLYQGVVLGIAASKAIALGTTFAQATAEKGILATLVAQAVVWAIANPFKALLGLAAAGAVGAVAYSAFSKAGDVNSPADGKTQISTKEGGLFELSSNDDIIAAPGASKAMAKAAQGGGTTVVQAPENKETNSLLTELVNQYKKQPQLSAVGLYEVQ
jgi:hypothetical protein